MLCVSNRHFGDFVQQERAPFGLAEEALAVGVGPGESAADGPEQLAFDQFAGQGGAVDLDDLAFAAGAQGMEEVGDDFLAGAALPSDEDGDIARRDAVDLADHVPHGGALEDGRRGSAHRLEGAPESAGLLVLALGFDGVLHVGQQLLAVELDIFAEKIEGAALDGLDRPGDGLVVAGSAGQDDDVGVGPAFPELGQQVQPVGIGQLDIQQDQVRLVLGQGPLERGAAVGSRDLVIVFQERRQDSALVFVIVNYQDFALHRNLLRLRTQARINARNSARCSEERCARRSG